MNLKSISQKIVKIPKSFYILCAFLIVYIMGMKYYFHDAVTKSDYVITEDLFWLLTITSMLLMVAFYVLLRFQQIGFDKIALIAIITIGGIYMFMFTPMSIPDETTHYSTTYHYSNMFMFKAGNDDATHVEMRECDKIMVHSSSNNVSMNSYGDVIKNYEVLNHSSKTESFETVTTSGRFLSYLPQSIGLTLGRLLNLGAYPSYYLGSLFNLVVYAGIIYFAVKIIPYGKIALVVGSLLPMSLHLASSFSYDAYVISSLFLLVAYLLKLIYSEDDSISLKQMIILTAISVLTVPVKVVYVCATGLVLLIPKSKFKVKKYHLLFKFVFLFITAASILLFQIGTILALGKSGSATQDTYNVSRLFASPFFAFSVFFKSFEVNGDFYISSFFGSSLGWLQVNVPLYVVYAFFGVFILSLMSKEDEIKPMKPLKKVYVFLILLASILFVLITLLFDYTPFKLNYAYGVQGRYFIPLIPLMLIVCRNTLIQLRKDAGKYLLFATVFLNLWALLKDYIYVVKLQ